MNARDYALALLDATALPGWAADLLPPRFRPPVPPPDPRDLALAEHLHIGGLKRLLTLHYHIESHAHRPLPKIDPLLQKVLAIGLYQLKYTRVPPHAAVDSAVNQTRSLGPRYAKSAGFVNAVLRNALREPAPPLPEPGDHRFAEVTLSHPQDLFRRFLNLLARPGIPIPSQDPYALATKLAEQDNDEPPTIVRVPDNAAVPSVEGVSITPHQTPGFFIISPAKRPLLAEWSARGIQVQDPTAAKVVPHLDVRPGLNVLDRCCGVGTKTLQILDRLAGQGHVTAIDPNPARLAALAAAAARRGHTNLAPIRATHLPPSTPMFDRILVDAPCSNSGVLPRRPEARYRQDPATLNSLNKLQWQILQNTLPALAPGGLLVYSTCSLWPEENQHLTQRLLATAAGLTLEQEELTLPSFHPDSPAAYHDGGYFAVLRRRT